MDLRRLARADARSWRAPIVLALVLVATQALGMTGRSLLPYERAAIVLDGEYWRLVTAHLYHFDVVHLAWNLAGLALVAWLFASEYTTRQWLVILAASTASVDLGFLVLEPQLEWYVGFSGVLHGLMAAGLLRWWQRQRDPLTLLVSAIFGLKLAWEHVFGALPFTEATLAIPVIHAAHSYGAVGGVVAAACLRGAQPRPAPSL